MPIFQSGTLNTTALYVPDVDVVIVPPQTLNLNGVPSSIIGMVGTASWGPVNVPVQVSSYLTYIQSFGTLLPRTNDIGTQVATAVLQGANNFQIVRVSDGTDTRASATILSTCLTVNSLWTGSFGNNITVTTLAGSKVGTTKVVVNLSAAGLSETYDNIAGTGAALWTNIATAINAGTTLRGPSQIITAVSGGGTTAPVVGNSYSLVGGTDGVTTITSSTLVGVDGAPRTGMYALRNQGVSLLILADMVDSTQFTTVASFALQEGMYAIVSGPAGDNIANAVTVKAGAGADSYGLKYLFGDFCYFNDQVDGVRLVSPCGFAVGRYGNLSPEQSGLNKPIYGIIGTQKTGIGATNGSYSAAELTTMAQNGIDVITNPIPAGAQWGLRIGHNSSSNPSINGDNYSRLTPYIARTLAAGMGVYVGALETPSLFAQISATLNSFCAAMQGANQIQAYQVQCSPANNPQSQTSLGITDANVNIQYYGINEKFLINLQGGVTVTIQSTGQQFGQTPEAV